MTLTRLLLSGAALLAISTPVFAQQALPQANDPYFKSAQAQLNERLALKPDTGTAKNIILMIGDGMGIPMITASRIYDGQKRGADGVSNKLAFETLPYAALSRTYSADAQVTDSAPSATAMTTGVKTRNDILGLNSDAVLKDCAGAKGKEVTTIFEMAEAAGKSTGAITTTRITHATPAAAYAHSANRDWKITSNLAMLRRRAARTLPTNWSIGRPAMGLKLPWTAGAVIS